MRSSLTFTLAIAILTALATVKITKFLKSFPPQIPTHVIETYTNWKLKHGLLTVSPSENNFRLRIFYQNYMKVQEVNKSNQKWKAGLNKFSAMTEEEFRAKYLGFKSK